ncbi:MAG TPA: hypothetical protein VJ790_08935 [Dongiaceae bacterium]|nr:hypothetical protein [Dongiaceae bacterium]
MQPESESAVEATRARKQAQGPGQAFLTLIEQRREDTVEIKGKQFRFRPYSSRGAADGAARETTFNGETTDTGTIGIEAEDDGIAVDVLDGFGAGARERNSTAFLASFIAQERPREGLYNPQHEAASDAYRRAGGSPSAVDNQPRVFSFAV